MNDLLDTGEELGSHSEQVNLAYDDETVVWEGRPSQWVNLGSFIFWTLLIFGSLVLLTLWNGGLNQGYSELVDTGVVAMIGIFMFVSCLNIVLPFLQTHFEYTVITKNKIKEAKGITSIFREEKFCEISDIKDIKSPRAGLLAFFGLSTLLIETNDEDQPIIRIRAIKNRDVLINKLLPIWRELKIERKGYFGDR